MAEGTIKFDPARKPVVVQVKGGVWIVTPSVDARGRKVDPRAEYERTGDAFAVFSWQEQAQEWLSRQGEAAAPRTFTNATQISVADIDSGRKLSPEQEALRIAFRALPDLVKRQILGNAARAGGVLTGADVRGYEGLKLNEADDTDDGEIKFADINRTGLENPLLRRRDSGLENMLLSADHGDDGDDGEEEEYA